MLILAKFVVLAFALVYGMRYLACIILNHSISEAHSWLMGFSIAGFVCLQWWL